LREVGARDIPGVGFEEVEILEPIQEFYEGKADVYPF